MKYSELKRDVLESIFCSSYVRRKLFAKVDSLLNENDITECYPRGFYKDKTNLGLLIICKTGLIIDFLTQYSEEKQEIIAHIYYRKDIVHIELDQDIQNMNNKTIHIYFTDGTKITLSVVNDADAYYQELYSESIDAICKVLLSNY